jgi:DNA-binding transcriptional ArsR family regulator
MAREQKPFEGVLGNTSELRLLQYLISLPKLDFNISELSRVSGVTRPPVDRVIKRFAEWGIVSVLPRRGNMTFYKLDEESPIVNALTDFNNALIEEMYPEARAIPKTIISVEQVESSDASGISAEGGTISIWPMSQLRGTSGTSGIVEASSLRRPGSAQSSADLINRGVFQ